MTAPVIAVLIDALRHDFITQTDTPFLFGLRNNSSDIVTSWGKLYEPFGFIPRAALFAGLSQDEAGCQAYFYFDFSESPFAIPTLIDWLPAKFQYVYLLFKCNLQYFLKKKNTLFTQIPIVDQKIRKVLNVTERLPPWHEEFFPKKNLFQLMREGNKKWLYYGYPLTDQRTNNLLNMTIRSLEPDVDFLWLHFAETDWAQHRHGPDSLERKIALRNVDEAIKLIYARFETLTDTSPILLVFGDHGAVEVKDTIDIQKLCLDKLGNSVPFYCDSTTLYISAEESYFSQVDGMLRTFEELGYGRIVTEKMKEKYRIRHPKNKFGTHFFVANPGILFLPNVFQGNQSLKGMHGYLPDDPDNIAAWQLSSPTNRDHGEVDQILDMVDLYKLLRGLVGAQE